jgi:hypothetical protein
VPLADLLERGFFPKELPRPFVTSSFASLVSQAGALSGDFAKKAEKGSGMPVSKLGRYSLARGGLFRRQLSIPNPLPYFHLARELIGGWTEVAPQVAGTALSATTPEFKTIGRAINGKWAQSARPQLAQRSRIGRRYVLQTDISRFYGSIYTHSIPWALHSKPTAKANHSFALLGNRLDYWVRMGQDQQTIGIPIGPDTSLVIAELLMQRCDETLAAKMPKVQGHRFIDDYELCFDTRTQAEDAYHILETCLGDFELALNAKKTSVLELPLPLEASWAKDLKRFSFRTSKSGQAADLAHFFSTAYELHATNPNEAVLQFAIARLRNLKLDPSNWDHFQQLCLLCVAPEPATLPYVLERLIAEKNAGAGPLVPELQDILNNLIADHSALRHSSEVANSVWACLALGLKMNARAVDAVSACEDSVVALLALDCEANGLVGKPLDKTLWASRMTTQDLYEEHWLLAYEANIKGWLPSAHTGDHVDADPNFSFLKSNGVSFYDKHLGAPAPAAPVPLPTLPTPPQQNFLMSP